MRTTQDLANAINLANTGVDVQVRNPSFQNIQITGALPPLNAGSLQFGTDTFSFRSLPFGGSLTANAPLRFRSANSDFNFKVSTNIGGSGPVSILSPGNTTRITFSGTNSYSGGTTVVGGTPSATGSFTPRTTLLFDNAASVPSTGNITLQQGGIVGVRFTINQAFVDRLTPDSVGVVAIAQGANSSQNLSFANLPNVSLGALGTPGFNSAGEPRTIVNSFYSGTLTPNGTTYRLGGGDGTLIVQSNLGNVSATPGGALVPTQLEVINNGNTQVTGSNTYTGGTHIVSGTLQIGFPGSLGGGAARDVQIDPGANLLTNFQLNQAILNRILPTSQGSVVLGTSTSNPLDFNAAGLTNVSLGGSQDFLDAGGAITTYSGNLTPAANRYRLGGSFGPLWVSSQLTGNNALEVPIGSVSLINTNNNYTGETRVTGSLSLGNGLQNGAINGTSGVVLTQNGSFSFAQATPFVFDKVISGNGFVSQSGPGTVTLTQPQQYTGSTSISATLVLGPGSSIASSSDVFLSSSDRARGILDLTAAGDQTIRGLSSFSPDTLVKLGPNTLTLQSRELFSSTFEGVIDGPGRIATAGDRGITLAGNNTYTGGTIIGHPFLQLGNGFDTNGTLGTGDVVINTSLILNQATAATLANQLSGPGSVTQFGPGTVTFTANNTYTGGTTIESGRLDLGNGGTSGSIVGNVANEGTLVFNRSDNLALDGVISGGGSVIQAGSGQTTLTGTSTYTGPTTVNAGTLLVNGSIGSSPVTVNAGATLGGSGTVGPTSITNGATLSPGAAGIGTLTVNGDLTLAPNSTYVVEVSPTAADRTNVTGTANLAGTVQAVFGPGSFDSRTYTILSAGARNGTFGALTTTGLPAFLRADLQYNATDALLVTLSSQIAPPPTPTPPSGPVTPAESPRPVFAITRNQRSVGGALDAIFNGGGGLFPGLAGLTQAQFPAALDALSGEIHASEVTAAIEGSRLVRDAIMGRLWQGLGNMGLAPVVFGAPAADLGARSPRPEAIPVRTFDPQVFALWGQGFGTWGRSDRDGNAATLHRDSGGFIAGADATFNAVSRIGVAGGFQRTTLDVPGRLSSGSTDSVFGALYGGTALGPLNLRLGASFAGQRTDIRRAILFPGFNDTARTAYDGYTAQAFGELGYRFPGLFGKSVIEPFVGATALTVHRDRFAEAGGPAALVGFARDTEVGYATLGIRTEWQPFDAPLVIRGMTGWRHTFGDVLPNALLAFRSNVATPFSISGVPLDRNVLVSETAVDWRVSDAVTLSVAYSGELARRASDNGVKGQVLVKF